MKKKRIILLPVLILLFVIAGLFVGYSFYIRKGVSVSPMQSYAPDNIVYFCQKDTSWAEDKLGDSSFTMGNSGCLTTCIAAVLLMQNITDNGMNFEITPGALNDFFSEKGVYDEEGNIQWEILENVTRTEVVRKDAEELEDGELEEILSNDYFPIVQVRVGGSGNYHYVLLTSSADGEFWCMDPLSEEDTLVPLSKFGGCIYSVRFIKNLS